MEAQQTQLVQQGIKKEYVRMGSNGRQYHWTERKQG